MIKSFRANIIVLAVGLFIVSGCAPIKTNYSGFLRDYSKIEESETEKGLLIERNPRKSVDQYTKFLLVPTVVYFHESAKGAEVDPTTLKELTDFIDTELKTAMEENFEIVQVPGDGVCIIRIALTDVVANKIYLNLHWSTTASGAGVGGAAMEAEFADSLTNERVLALVDARKGKRLKYTKGLSKWGHTKDVLRQWVKLITTTIGGVEDLKEGEDGE